MATPTYTAIASITLGSSASSVTFSSIPQDYRDLVLVVQGIYTTGNRPGIIEARFNNDSGVNYPQVEMRGDGSSTNSVTSTNVSLHLGFTLNENMQVISQIMDYSATDKHKTVLSRSNDATYRVEARALRWENTSAVTEIDVFTGQNDFQTGMTIALYGIEA